MIDVIRFQRSFQSSRTRFQHGSINFENTTILYLDTLNEDPKNKHGGLMCNERLQWLENSLNSGNGPIILLAHHHMLTLDSMEWMKFIYRMVGTLLTLSQLRTLPNGYQWAHPSDNSFYL